MIKRNLLNLINIIILTFLSVEQEYAADFNAASSNSPAQIVIQNASVIMSNDNKNTSIRLIAKNNKNLHINQIYQANFRDSTSSDTPDASYNTQKKNIYIERLFQAGSMVHRVTLKQVDTNPFEFMVVKINTTVMQDTRENQFFNPSSVHRVELLPLSD